MRIYWLSPVSLTPLSPLSIVYPHPIDTLFRYWDWTLDADKPEASPVWSNDIGFGGNGSGEKHCVQGGRFAELRPKYPRPHCLRRKFSVGMYGYNYTTAVVDDLLSNAESYHEFRSQLETGAHKSVHNGIGGEMPTDSSSNGEIRLPVPILTPSPTHPPNKKFRILFGSPTNCRRAAHDTRQG